MVLTMLKNISQIGSSSQLLGKIKYVPNHQPVMVSILLLAHILWKNKKCSKPPPRYYSMLRPEMDGIVDSQTYTKRPCVVRHLS
jgi:hypothetical protein